MLRRHNEDIGALSDRPAGSIRLDDTTMALGRRLLAEHVRPQLGRIALALVCMAMVAGSTAALAHLMEPVVNEIFVNKQGAMLPLIAASVLAVFVVRGLATYAQSVLMNRVGQRIIADMQHRLFRHLMGADLAFFHDTSTGTLIARFTNDVALLRNVVSSTLTSLGKDALTLVGLVGLMFAKDWQLAAVAFFAFPLAVLPIVRIGGRMRKVSARTQAQMAEFTTFLDQTFQGARLVKAYGMQAYEAGRAGRIVENLFRLVVKAARVRSLAHPIMEVLAGLAIVAVILYGGQQVIAESKTPGAFFAFMTALMLAYEPLKKLAQLNANLQEGLAAAQRVFAALDMRPSIVDAPDAEPLRIDGGSLRFEKVSFAYGTDKPAIFDIDLAVPAGRTVALVGPSGAGKSTILNLIPRFYDIESGRLTIDGQETRRVTLDSLRANLALVSQEVSLFDDSVRANIAYGRLDADEAAIRAAARAAGADAFIRALPQGYDTLVGEHGVKLSGGQRQRIAIARAMLKNAPILLLDEATSALDTDAERQVQEALNRLMRGRTTVVIAHRLSTVVNADLIYVIDGGRVVECGSHAELMARGGEYARLYALQFADELPAAPAAVRAAARA
jgi:subfamily B ATP-binding cassette protein MsbA